MSKYLVVRISEQNIRIYRVSAETPKEAIDESLFVDPFREHYLENIYGHGVFVIPYSTANVILTYIKLLLEKF